jgi:hypothetical protein
LQLVEVTSRELLRAVDEHYDRHRAEPLWHHQPAGQVGTSRLKARFRYIERDALSLQAIEADLAGIAF